MNDRFLAMRERYECGETLQAVGADFGVTRERVRQILKHGGVHMRKLSERRPPKVRVPKPIGRPRHSPELKRHPVSFRTRATMRDRMIAASVASGRSLSQEIEHRLERSFRDDDVAEAIWSRLAGKLERK